MVKHTHAICQLLPTNCLSVFDHFVGLVLKELNLISTYARQLIIFLLRSGRWNKFYFNRISRDVET